MTDPLMPDEPPQEPEPAAPDAGGPATPTAWSEPAHSPAVGPPPPIVFQPGDGNRAYPGPAHTEIGPAVSWTMDAVKRQLVPLGVATLLEFVGPLGLVVGWFVFLFSGSPDRFTDRNVDVAPSMAPVLIVWVGMVLFSVAFQAVAAVYGLQLARQVADGESVSVGRALRTAPWGRGLLGSLLWTGITLLGIPLCFIPGLIASMLTPLYMASVVDGGRSPVDAVKEIVQFLRERTGAVLLLGLAAYGISQAGAMLCYIGLLASIPFSRIFVLHLYRGYTGRPITYWY